MKYTVEYHPDDNTFEVYRNGEFVTWYEAVDCTQEDIERLYGI